MRTESPFNANLNQHYHYSPRPKPSIITCLFNGYMKHAQVAISLPISNWNSDRLATHSSAKVLCFNFVTIKIRNGMKLTISTGFVNKSQKVSSRSRKGSERKNFLIYRRKRATKTTTEVSDNENVFALENLWISSRRTTLNWADDVWRQEKTIRCHRSSF